MFYVWFGLFGFFFCFRLGLSISVYALACAIRYEWINLHGMYVLCFVSFHIDFDFDPEP